MLLPLKSLLGKTTNRSVPRRFHWLTLAISNRRSGEFLFDRTLADNNVFCRALNSRPGW
jgi:hypothetical protein